MEQNKLKINSYLERISNILIINGGFLDSAGLYTGEMGLVLFFFHYARLTNNKLYADYGLYLIENIQNNINKATPIDYRHGLAGIGSTIEYLVQNGFIEADTDDILEVLDSRIFSMNNLPDLTSDELFSKGYYALWRIAGSSAKKYTILKKILPEIVRLIEKNSHNHRFTCPLVSFLKNLIENENSIELHEQSIISNWFHYCHNNFLFGLGANTFIQFIEEFSKNDFFEKNPCELGLINGLAGFGMSLLIEHSGDDSWIVLFPNDLNFINNESLPNS